MLRKRIAATGLALAFAGSGFVAATAQEKSKEKVKEVVVSQDKIVIAGPGGGGGGGVTVRSGGGDAFVFVSSEMTFDGKLVKGAPYSAEAVTETTQILADGNRIVRKNSAQIYRDSEGRTRRDQTFSAVGPFATAGEPAQSVFIHDPVAGVHYILDPRTRTARKIQPRVMVVNAPGAEGGPSGKRLEGPPTHLPPPRPYRKGSEGPKVERPGGYVFHAPAPPPHAGHGPDMMIYTHETGKPKVEQLGEETIEGVKAEGTRHTVTIPAGAIGNDREINIVTEQWRSPELQTTVMKRHSDPRFGETVFRLTNINRAEPASSLFQVPSDYAVKEDGPGAAPMRMRKPKGDVQFHFEAKPDLN